MDADLESRAVSAMFALEALTDLVELSDDVPSPAKLGALLRVVADAVRVVMPINDPKFPLTQRGANDYGGP